MREVKLGTRTEDPFSAFFENENPYENSALDFVNNSKMAELKDDEFLDKGQTYINFLKQSFLFFPGTFFLFYISMGTAIILTEVLINSANDFFFSNRMILIYLVGLLAVFMTWFGLGDIKNKKHLVIPSSIIVSGILIGATVRLTENISGISAGIIRDFGYAICLFPIGLIVPFLAKGWVDKKAK